MPPEKRQVHNHGRPVIICFWNRHSLLVVRLDRAAGGDLGVYAAVGSTVDVAGHVWVVWGEQAVATWPFALNCWLVGWWRALLAAEFWVSGAVWVCVPPLVAFVFRARCLVYCHVILPDMGM